jgi:DNA-binding winged helix-turn-helix (wHTH) protein/tetratricopeptide (TPR) repeat protein
MGAWSYRREVNFLFGQFELDARGYKLRRDGEDVPLQPKVFDAIRYLVENRDRVVLKEELLEALWPGEHVNDTAVPWTISRARKALGQGPEAKYPIETVRGRGYRFSADVLQTQPSTAAPGPISSKVLSVDHAERDASALESMDPFVGRSEAIERLLGALHGARNGRGRLCLLLGDAGIGKTRCISEFARQVRRLKLSVSSGRCLEGGRTAAFWPWVQVLRDALAEEGLPAELKAEGQSLLADLIPRQDPAEGVADAEAVSTAFGARYWVLEKLSRFLLKSGDAVPRVIFLEDVHWADEASLDLLAFLAAELSQVPVLVVATARDGMPSASEAWARMSPRLGPSERIVLQVLKPKDVEDYVATVTGHDFPPEIHRTVYTKCGGNPLFLQESVRLMAAQCDTDGVSSLRTGDIRVPGVARDVLRGRLSGLSGGACEALETACVIGQEFELPVLQAALGIEAEPLLARLDEAMRARVVAPRPRAGTYAFEHETIREALYEELASSRRADLHRRVAEAIEARSAGDLRHNDLAYHYYRGLPRAEPAKVEQQTRLAGESALRRYAYEDAAQFFGWALEAQRFQGGVDPRRCCEVLIAYGGALRMSGRLQESRDATERAIAIARQNRYADLLWAAARGLRPTVRSALVPDRLALEALEDASKLASEDQVSLRIRVLSQLSCIPPYSLSTDRSHELSDRAVKLARKSGHPGDLAHALISRLHVLSGPDHLDDLLATTDEILRLDPNSAVEVELARYCTYVHKGDIPAADAALERYGQGVQRLRRAEAMWHHERLVALRFLHAGEFDRADTRFHELFVQARRLRLPYDAIHMMMHASAVAYERHGLGAMDGATWKGVVEWAAGIPSFQAHWVRFLMECRRRDDARESFEALARDGFTTITRDIGYLNALAHLSLAAVWLQDEARARVLYELLKPYPHHNTPNGFNYYLGSVSFFLGVLARFLGETRDAVRHFEDAAAMNLRLGMVPQWARTQAALGDLLADTGRPADRQRAESLLAEASETAGRLEMAPLVAEVARSQARLAATAIDRPPAARARG